jgi:hypothetical protein
MSSSLRDFQELVIHSVGDELLTARARESLLACAQRLPCIARTLLECRLIASDDRVDLSQSFLREDSDVLNACLQQMAHTDPRWIPVLQFLEAWRVPGNLLQRAITGVWFEFDLQPGPGGSPALPGLFLNFAPLDSTDVTLSQLRQALVLAMDILGAGETPVAFLQALDNCVEKMPAHVVPSYVGLMLSRQPFSLRAQFGGFTRNSLLAFLDALRFDAVPESFSAALDLSDQYFQSFVFCIDLMPEMSARLGIELFPRQYRHGMNDAVFLEALASQGLCSDAKREAALAWPGRIQPGGDVQNWPEQLLMQSLAKPIDEFGLIERQINHYKLVSTPGHPVDAKIYLAANHLWASFTGDNASARDE